MNGSSVNTRSSVGLKGKPNQSSTGSRGSFLPMFCRLDPGLLKIGRSSLVGSGGAMVSGTGGMFNAE